MAESRRITYYLGLADKLESEQNLSDEELSILWVGKRVFQPEQML